MKNITAIIFDLGVVILNINYQNTIDAFEKIGVKNSQSFYSKKYQINLFNKIETGKISQVKFLLELQKRTAKASIHQIKNAWNSMLLDLPIKRVILLKKISLNYTSFLLSNTNQMHIAKFKANIGRKRYNDFYNIFTKVYYSHEIGHRKPEPEAFKLILDENQLNANEVLFIDDSPQHIEGAKKIGLKTHLLKEHEDITNLFPDIIL